jgi:hypothetical protein
MTRPTFVPVVVAGCIWLGVKLRSGWTVAAGRLAVTFTACLLLLIPVGLIARHETGRFTLLPTSGGVNLYIGNNPDYQRTLTIRHNEDWNELVNMPSRYGVPYAGYDRFFKEQVITYAKTQPFNFAAGLARKAIEFVSSREIPRNVDIYMFSKWSHLLGLLCWKVAGFGFPFGLILPLAAVGLAYNRRQISMPLILFVLLYPASIILVFVAGRYRVPIIPVVIILAAAGLCTIIRAIRLKQSKKLITVSTLVVAIVLLSSLPGPFCEEQVNYEAEF